jgi:small multidrug resistance family-3 protein
MFDFFRVTGLSFTTAVAEIVGFYLPWLVLRQGRPLWWLLTLHPSAAG